jgi:putative transposase
VRYIDEHREIYGVEPICKELQIAPSLSYAAESRPPSARRLRDEELKVDITRVHKENFDVYGAEKMWLQLNREGIPVGRDRVARLMPEVGLAGVVRGKVWRTTFPADVGQRPADLVDRKFSARSVHAAIPTTTPWPSLSMRSTSWRWRSGPAVRKTSAVWFIYLARGEAAA